MTTPRATARSIAPALESNGSGGGVTVRWRSVALGLVLAVGICALTPYNNVYRHGTPLGGGHFPMAPFAVFMALSLGVAGLGRVLGRLWLTGTELLVVWVQMVLASGVAYTGLARTFFINLTAPLYYASVGNRWQDLLHPLLPSGLYPRQPDAVQTLYDGLPGVDQGGWWGVLTAVPWDAWILPLCGWGAFVLLCYVVVVCLIDLLSHQALDNERMNFPLLRVPLMVGEAVDQGRLGAFMADRYLLAGLALPVALHLLNGLHFYIPAVPQMPTLILTGSYFPKTGLFSGFYKLKIYIYPAFVGFAFLTARQISLSFWLFFLLGGLLAGLLGVLGYNVPAAALGVTFGPTLARPEEMQMVGAYAVFFLFLLWLARHHLAQVAAEAFGRSRDQPLAAGWLPVRAAFWTLATGTLVLVLWLRYFGLATGEALLLLGAGFVFMLVATRVICQGGVAYFTLTAAPLDAVIALGGSKLFSQAGLLLSAAAQKVLFLDLRESLMPSVLHTHKAARPVEGRRVILTALGATLVVSVVVSLAAMLAVGYRYGLRELNLEWETRTVLTAYRGVADLVQTPMEPNAWVRAFIVMGAVGMLALVTCYHRFYWWPVHPLGYLTMYASGMRVLWFAFFLGWLANMLCMRYGGVVLFKRLRFFFIGMIIGDFLMAGAWAVVGMFADASYPVLPD